jgi:hypothetical protein
MSDKQRIEALAQGKCRECFKRKARKGKKTCGPCSRKGSARVKRNREKKKESP